MSHSRIVTVVAGLMLVLGVVHPARADVAPPGIKGVRYSLTIANRAQYPNHVFIVYPTTNNLYGYVLEEGKPISNLMMRRSWKGGASALYAMQKSVFEKYAAGSHHYPHGDNGELVNVVPRPPAPPDALPAKAEIAGPQGVPEASPIEAIERVYRIKTLTDAVFELVLDEEVTVYKGGKREKRKIK